LKSSLSWARYHAAAEMKDLTGWTNTKSVGRGCSWRTEGITNDSVPETIHSAFGADIVLTFQAVGTATWSTKTVYWSDVGCAYSALARS